VTTTTKCSMPPICFFIKGFCMHTTVHVERLCWVRMMTTKRLLLLVKYFSYKVVVGIPQALLAPVRFDWFA
jgi:hypothetical protein